MLGGSVDTEVRRAHELQILEAHYDALTSSPGGPSRDEYRWGEHVVGYQVTAPPISPRSPGRFFVAITQQSLYCRNLCRY